MTLHDRLDTRDNALNFLRLILAGLVIVSHTWPLGGFGDDPHLGDMSLGAFSVAGFFAISGYLITGSRMSLPLGQFALRRALRILPGFWVCLVVVAFMFAPLTALGTGTPFDLSRAMSFVWSNVTTVMSQLVIGGELGRAPNPTHWDGSLWTLQHEMLCYALTGLVLCWGLARRRVTRTAVAVLSILTALNVAFAQAGLVGATLVDFVWMAAYFAAGSLLWSLRDRIRVNRWWVGGAALSLGVFQAVGVAHEVGALPLAYLMLAFGAWCPIRWGVSRDLSYGVYVYAFPVQQVLALAGVQRFGPAVFILAAVALVVPLAWLSWTFVERPSLRLARRRSPVAELADGSLPAGPATMAERRPDQAVVTTELAQRWGHAADERQTQLGHPEDDILLLLDRRETHVPRSERGQQRGEVVARSGGRIEHVGVCEGVPSHDGCEVATELAPGRGHVEALHPPLAAAVRGVEGCHVDLEVDAGAGDACRCGVRRKGAPDVLVVVDTEANSVDLAV